MQYLKVPCTLESKNQTDLTIFAIFTISENTCNRNRNYKKAKINKQDLSNENIQNFHFLLENTK